jgi:hypothetical protein
MPCHRRPIPLSGLASVLSVVGIVLAVAGCSHITPLGPDSGLPAMPPQRHLGSPIIMQLMRSQPPTTAGACPAGWLTVYLPGSPGPHLARSFVSIRGSSASPAPAPSGPSGPQPPPTGLPCYRPVGTPVTITSASVSRVSAFLPPPAQPKGPVTYGFTVAVPAGEVASVTALIAQAYSSGEAVGLTVAGKLWQAPQVFKPFPGQLLEVGLLSRSQAVQLYRILVPSG